MLTWVDNVKGLGDYLELEILADEEAQREEALEKLERILNQLGYCMQDTTRTSYLSMSMSLTAAAHETRGTNTMNHQLKLTGLETCGYSTFTKTTK